MIIVLLSFPPKEPLQLVQIKEICLPYVILSVNYKFYLYYAEDIFL